MCRQTLCGARQVRDTLGALAERFTALKLNNGGLHLSRLKRMHGKALALKRIVMYSPAWVKSQNRMASTSNQVHTLENTNHPSLLAKSDSIHVACTNNVRDGQINQCPWPQTATHGRILGPGWCSLTRIQWAGRCRVMVSLLTHGSVQETFRVEHVEGRGVLDVLRHALTACNLASFSLVDCCQSLLSRRMEVLPPSAITRLSSLSNPARSMPPPTADAKQLHAALEGDVRGCICQTRRISPPMVLLGSHFTALVPICGS